MKKQLLIAAVAATMTSVAMADISITGGMKVNSTTTDHNSANTNAISHEADLKVTGKTGGTDFYMEINNDSADGTDDDSNLGVEDIHMTTSIAGVKVKAGTWNGTDNILNADSPRGAGKYALSGDIAGIGILVEGQGNGEASTGVTLSTTVSGVAVSYKNETHQDQYKASGSISGLNYAIHHVKADAANSDETSVEVSYDYNGVVLSYANADADSSAVIAGDAYFGNMATVERGATDGMVGGDDVSGFGIKTDIAGNTVQAKFVNIDATTSANDSDIVKLVATRALESGVTLELTYTDEDSDTAANDKNSFDVELAVAF